MRLIICTLLMVSLTIVAGGIIGSCGYKSERYERTPRRGERAYTRCHRHPTKRYSHKPRWHCHRDPNFWEHHDNIDGVTDQD